MIGPPAFAYSKPTPIGSRMSKDIGEQDRCIDAQSFHRCDGNLRSEIGLLHNSRKSC